MIRNVISYVKIGLRDSHSQRIDIVDMPTFRTVYRFNIFDGKIVAITSESNIRIRLPAAIATPEEEEFTFVMSSVKFFRRFLRKKC